MEKISGKMITYYGVKNEINAYFSKQVGKTSRGALILIHEIWGINIYVKNLADQFAKKGFVVLVPDIYSSSAFSGILTEQDIGLLQNFSTTPDRSDLIDEKCFTDKLSKLPKSDSERILEIISMLKNGTPKDKLIDELIKATDFLYSENLLDRGKVAIITVKPVKKN